MGCKKDSTRERARKPREWTYRAEASEWHVCWVDPYTFVRVRGNLAPLSLVMATLNRWFSHDWPEHISGLPIHEALALGEPDA